MYMVFIFLNCIVFFFSKMVPQWNISDERELYDLDKDPVTNINVAGMDEYVNELERMDRLLHAGWRNAWLAE